MKHSMWNMVDMTERSGWAATQPIEIHERVFNALEIATRPLQSGEIERALALHASDLRCALDWLSRNNYVTHTLAEGWSLSSRGCARAREKDAGIPETWREAASQQPVQAARAEGELVWSVHVEDYLKNATPTASA